MSKAQPKRPPQTSRNRGRSRSLPLRIDTEPPSSSMLITGQGRRQDLEVVEMPKEVQAVRRYGLMQLCGEHLAGLREAKRYREATICLFAILLLYFLPALAGSHWVSTWHLPSWLAWLR